MAIFSVQMAWSQEAYRLGPGDRIALRVLSWDRIELQFVEFNALGGEYAVGPDGYLMVPAAGRFEAAGLTVEEIADEVTDRLESGLGLADAPSASVEVVGFRPVYLLGDVAQPGPIEFAPGLTVQQAVALAGGTRQVFDNGPEGMAAALRAVGTLRELGQTLVRQQVRAARLQAERDGAETFAQPSPMDHFGDGTSTETVYELERSLFESRREAQKRALAALDSTRSVLETEIANLEEKLSGQARQVAIVKESVGNMESLVDRGLATSPTFVSLQRQLIDLENRELDTETNVFRARQAISELESDRVELEAGRQLEVLRELQNSEAEIQQTLARQDTVRQLLVGSQALLDEASRFPEVLISYRVTRTEGGLSRQMDAAAATVLKPSDVLEVTVSLPESAG